MSNTPIEFQCPITFDIMVDPVIGDDGHTYERAAILESLSRDNRSPMTRAYMTASSLRPNYALKSQIERFVTANPQTTVTPKPFVSHPLILTALNRDNGTMDVTITPPSTGERQPIVMLIALDNSGSMGENASADTNETGGLAFTRMDLCKHTIRTVAGMLHDDDIFGLVSFSTVAKVVLKPAFMTADGKARLEAALKTVNPDSQTNIWAGLETIHRLAIAPEFANSHVVTALLTDGLPNINPPRGIVETYRTLVKPYTMSTFGFGYSLDSKLLDDIATEGKGSFGFIPDYSMVATVFINWAAVALATASKSSQIQLQNETVMTVTTVTSGEIQIGQPRTFICKPALRVTLGTVTVEPVASTAPIEFLTARNDITNAIKLCVQSNGDSSLFHVLHNTYALTTDANLKELLRDIQPTVDEGQVIMAPRYYNKWGKHYLRAYLKAQELEQCMNFKDHGLQIYGGALFRTVQAEGEAMFSALPALEPSGYSTASAVAAAAGIAGAGITGAGIAGTGITGIAGTGIANPVQMAHMFYNSGGGCFHGDSFVRMANDVRKRMRWIRQGEEVWTPSGKATIKALVVCNTTQPTQSMCKINHLLITPWHPILVDAEWVFPYDISTIEHMPLQTVYNVLLDSGHIIDVDNIMCATLAHNLTGPVIEHEFFGTERVVEDLKKVPGWEVGLPTFKNLCAHRNPTTGRIDGWYDGV